MSSALLDRPRTASAASFERVYRRYVRDVYRVAAGVLGNPQDAEDATQTTFMRAYRALERGERVRNVHAWLLAIARNVCREQFRRNGPALTLVELDGDGAAAPETDGPSATEIRDAMQHLPFNHRLVLVLREIEGRSYNEIATAMELSVPAIETLLFRARRALREQLEASEHAVGCDGIHDLISRQIDGRLSLRERGLLRAHLRSCAECARAARSERSRRRLMPALAGPLPATLSGAFQAGGGVVASKAAALAVAAALTGAGVFVAPRVLPDDADRARAASPREGVAAETTEFVARGLSSPRADLTLTRTASAKHAAPATVRLSPSGRPAGSTAAPSSSGAAPAGELPDAAGSGAPSSSPPAPGSGAAPAAGPPAAPPSPPASKPPSAAPPPPSASPAAPPAGVPPVGETRPGWGYGDENHEHTGPPGRDGQTGKP